MSNLEKKESNEIDNITICLVKEGETDCKKKKKFQIQEPFTNKELLYRMIAIRLSTKFSLIKIRVDQEIDQYFGKRVFVESFQNDIEDLEINQFKTAFPILNKKYKFEDKDYPILWIKYNKEFIDSKGEVIDPSKDKVRGHYGILVSKYGEFLRKLGYSDRFSSDVISQVKRINLGIRLESEEIKEDLIYINTISKEKSSVTTDLVITKKTIETDIKIGSRGNGESLDIYELFNMIVPTEKVPFMKIDSIYKILKDFEPLAPWIDIDRADMKDQENGLYIDKYIYLKVLNVGFIVESNRGNSFKFRNRIYSDVKISKRILKGGENSLNKGENDSDGTKNVFTVRVESDIRDEIDSKGLINIIKSLFGNLEDYPSEYLQSNIEASFNIPNVDFFEVALRDLCMLNPTFSYFANIDEKHQPFKTKENILIHFNFNRFDTYADGKPSLFGNVVASLRNDIVRFSDVAFISDDFKVGSRYLKVNVVRTKDENMARKFQRAFSKLIMYYNTKKDSIGNGMYIKNVENFKELYMKISTIEENKKKIRSAKLDDVAPNIFGVGYSRRICQKIQAPQFIDEKTEKMLIDKGEGYRVMKFPENHPTEKTRTYACMGSSTYQYIRTKPSTLPNRKDFPKLPCCFMSETEKKKNTGKKNFITKNKKLVDGGRGLLPTGIDNLLQVLDPEKTNAYIREGTTNNISENQNSIFITLGKIFGEEMDDQKEYIKLKREEMLKRLESKESGSSISIWQEAYNHTYLSIKELLENEDEYIDPKLFIRELEKMYNCHIFIFGRNLQNPDGYLEAPSYVEKYLTSLEESIKDYSENEGEENKDEEETSSRKNRFVLIYEHIGGESDITEYPQSEMIGRIEYPKKEDKSARTEKIFSYNDKLIERIVESFRTLYISHRNDRLDINFKSKILAQKVDIYGKTRYLSVEFGKNKIIVLTNPLPVFPVKRNIDELKPINESIIKEFLKFEGIKDFEYISVGDKIVGISAKKGDVEIYVPMKKKNTEEKGISNNISVPSFIHPYNEKSQLEKFKDLKRRARYLSEYFLYQFSLFQIEKKDLVFDPEAISLSDSKVIPKIERFINENVIGINDFDYGEFKRKYDSSVFLDEKRNPERKFVVNDSNDIKKSDLLKRLIYVLRLEIKNNLDGLIQYGKQEYINNFYKEADDFAGRESFLVISNEDQFRRLVNNRKVDYNTTDLLKYVEIPPIEFKQRTIEEKKTTFAGEEYVESRPESFIERNKRLILLSVSIHLSMIPFIYSNIYVDRALGGRLGDVDDEKRVSKSGVKKSKKVYNWKDGKKYICQSVPSKTHAYQCCEVWNDKGYNIGAMGRKAFVDPYSESIKITSFPTTADQYIDLSDLREGLIQLQKVEDTERVAKEIKRLTGFMKEPNLEMNLLFQYSQSEIVTVTKDESVKICIYYTKKILGENDEYFYFALLPVGRIKR